MPGTCAGGFFRFTVYLSKKFFSKKKEREGEGAFFSLWQAKTFFSKKKKRGRERAFFFAPRIRIRIRVRISIPIYIVIYIIIITRRFRGFGARRTPNRRVFCAKCAKLRAKCATKCAKCAELRKNRSGFCKTGANAAPSERLRQWTIDSGQLTMHSIRSLSTVHCPLDKSAKKKNRSVFPNGWTSSIDSGQ